MVSAFGAVLAAYWTYALLAVPLIEPAAGPPVADQSDGGGPVEPFKAVPKEFAELFPPDAWELKEPKVLENDRVKVLVQDYNRLPDGSLCLCPCTMIFMPSADDSAERYRKATVVEVPGGAELQFDPPFDLHQLKVGRLVRGKLRGRITIRSPARLPASGEDLLVVANDVELIDYDARSPGPVEFRWGPHYGRGEQMHIRLKPRDGATAGAVAGTNIGGIESFEVQSVQRLHLELGKLSSHAPGAAGSARTAPGATGFASAAPGATGFASASASASMPVEVTCRGPFHFDLTRQLATFEDQVDVLRIHPVGPCDRLSCELFSIYFRPKAKPAADRDQARKAGSFDLEPERIEARGHPAALAAPSDHVTAQGDCLQYDLQANWMALESPVEAVLQQGTNEIHSRSLRYETTPNGRIGRVTAAGPGWLQAQMADRPEQQIHARWKEQLLVRPENQAQVITLSGGSELSFIGIGQLSARDIELRLLELPDAKDARSRYQPERLLARGAARIESPQLSSAVEQLEVHFEPGAVQGAKGDSPISAATKQGSVPEIGTVSFGNAAAPRTASAFAPPTTLESLPPHAAAVAAPPQQHIEVLGRSLYAKAFVQDQRSELTELTVDGNVHFAETRTAQPNDKPLLVTGNQLHVTDASRPTTLVTVLGAPAYFEGRGMSLSGPNINLDRGNNHLWIAGPGRMNVLVDRDMEGRPMNKPSNLQVDWQTKMDFDGGTAHFEGGVLARGPTQQLQTQSLEVGFEQPIRFSEPHLEQPPKVERIVCRGGALLENDSYDAAGLPQSHDRMGVTDLGVNLKNGALTAGGPGWLTSVRRGGAEGMFPTAAPLSGGAAAAAPPGAPAKSRNADQLTCLDLRFQGSITGNILRRETTFRDRVRAAYAPVPTWWSTLPGDDPALFGPNGVILHCEQLSVNDMTPRGSPNRAVELLATGNVVAESTVFTARGIRMSYAEIKDLLILEGDGRTDAELYRQQHPGSTESRAAAQKIFFWPKTNRVSVAGLHPSEFNQFPGQQWQPGNGGPLAPRGR
ncbi:MAG: hypothetical protein ABSG68_13555 [Thermoguttaceae bacterium]|jgi:hypothetical protein